MYCIVLVVCNVGARADCARRRADSVDVALVVAHDPNVRAEVSVLRQRVPNLQGLHPNAVVAYDAFHSLILVADEHFLCSGFAVLVNVVQPYLVACGDAGGIPPVEETLLVVRQVFVVGGSPAAFCDGSAVACHGVQEAGQRPVFVLDLLAEREVPVHERVHRRFVRQSPVGVLPDQIEVSGGVPRAAGVRGGRVVAVRAGAERGHGAVAALEVVEVHAVQQQVVADARTDHPIMTPPQFSCVQSGVSHDQRIFYQNLARQTRIRNLDAGQLIVSTPEVDE